MFLIAQLDYPGWEGFLGTRGSFMLDVVFLAMFAVLPVLAWSISLVKKRQFALHKTVQLLLGTVLLLAVVAFEVDMRLNGWEERAIPSPYFNAEAKWSCPTGISLIIHLFFAVPTAFIWVYVIVMALRKFDAPPVPNAYSHTHKRWGWIAAVEMNLTALTGWIFYYLAFVATKN
jgi:putative membrane protein